MAEMKNYITLKTGDELSVTVHVDYQPYEPATLEYPGAERDATITSVILDRTGNEIDCRDETLERFRIEFLEQNNHQRGHQET